MSEIWPKWSVQLAAILCVVSLIAFAVSHRAIFVGVALGFAAFTALGIMRYRSLF